MDQLEVLVLFLGISLTASMIIVLVNPSVLVTPLEMNQYDSVDQGDISDTSIDEDKRFIIGDVNIIYETDLKGSRVGKNYDEIRNTIYIEDGHSVKRTKEICEHEVMHMKGIGEESHDYIRDKSDEVNTKICNRFIFELGKYVGKN